MRFAAGFAIGALALAGLTVGGLGWLLHKLDVDLAGVRHVNGWHLIADDLDDNLAGYAREGQRDLERYLAKVAALDVWMAAHPERP